MTLGITRLPLFLQNSQRLYVLVDSKYMTRLWCVFEVAVYLRLREAPKVIFISMDKRILGIVFMLVTIGMGLVVNVAENITIVIKKQIVTDGSKISWIIQKWSMQFLFLKTIDFFYFQYN